MLALLSNLVANAIRTCATEEKITNVVTDISIRLPLIAYEGVRDRTEAIKRQGG